MATLTFVVNNRESRLQSYESWALALSHAAPARSAPGAAMARGTRYETIDEVNMILQWVIGRGWKKHGWIDIQAMTRIFLFGEMVE